MISDSLSALLKRAKLLSTQVGSTSISCDQLFILAIDELLKFETLRYANNELCNLKSKLCANLDLESINGLYIKPNNVSCSYDLQKIIAQSISKFHKHNSVGITIWHLLYTIFEAQLEFSYALIECGIKKEFISTLISDAALQFESNDNLLQLELLSNNSIKILEQYAVEFTNTSVSHSFDDLIGRESELNQVIEVLLRRKKNNPLLIGCAGVGKTAIVEGLAKQISQGRCIPDLAGCRIFSLDMASIIAGTRYRGDFETRIKHILEIASLDPKVILFIDEIHTVVGAGGTQGSLDVANILKPYLARQLIKCIGATTELEYQMYFENDKALSRRFTKIIVKEPSEKDTIDILKKIKNKYEDHHNVIFTDQSLEKIVSISKIYLPDRSQPDASIDILDIIATRVKISNRPDNTIVTDDVEKYFGIKSV
ncbi:MAG: AAA family ATPase [Alphaproteobacteria bacterium]|jgi:ATP-dependent Clp protease ATP-binding subunit ClpA